jgi:hypothetical protein
LLFFECQKATSNEIKLKKKQQAQTARQTVSNFLRELTTKLKIKRNPLKFELHARIVTLSSDVQFMEALLLSCCHVFE